MEILNDDLQLALAGREYWKNIKENYSIDDDCYLILFPEDDQRLNESAIQNVTAFLARKYIQRAVILSVDRNVDRMFEDKGEQEIQFGCIDQEKMNGILKYYRLTQFAKNIVVVSMDEPFGNRNIIGKAGITLDDYVRDAIFV